MRHSRLHLLPSLISSTYLWGWLLVPSTLQLHLSPRHTMFTSTTCMRNMLPLRRPLLSTWARTVLRKRPFSRSCCTKKIDEESISDYDSSSYYPVQLNETFGGSYTAKVKLGFGRTSTIWLCKDDQYATFNAVHPIQSISVY
jgi:hypothetical protein